jgi:integrase
VRLDKITVAAVEKLRADLRAENYAPRTINTIIRIVGAIFKSAIRRGECALNPCERLEPAFKASRELDQDGIAGDDTVDENAVLSPAEMPQLLDAAEPGYYRTLFTTAYLTGMRSGELLALTWGAVEFNADGRGQVYVRRSLSWSRVNRDEAVRARFYPPKTKAGL